MREKKIGTQTDFDIKNIQTHPKLCNKNQTKQNPKENKHTNTIPEEAAAAAPSAPEIPTDCS